MSDTPTRTRSSLTLEEWIHKVDNPEKLHDLAKLCRTRDRAIRLEQDEKDRLEASREYRRMLELKREEPFYRQSRELVQCCLDHPNGGGCQDSMELSIMVRESFARARQRFTDSLRLVVANHKDVYSSSIDYFERETPYTLDALRTFIDSTNSVETDWKKLRTDIVVLQSYLTERNRTASELDEVVILRESIIPWEAWIQALHLLYEPLLSANNNSHHQSPSVRSGLFSCSTEEEVIQVLSESEKLRSRLESDIATVETKLKGMEANLEECRARVRDCEKALQESKVALEESLAQEYNMEAAEILLPHP